MSVTPLDGIELGDYIRRRGPPVNRTRSPHHGLLFAWTCSAVATAVTLLQHFAYVLRHAAVELAFVRIDFLKCNNGPMHHRVQIHDRVRRPYDGVFKWIAPSIYRSMFAPKRIAQCENGARGID
jgi:hypothetical protein